MTVFLIILVILLFGVAVWQMNRIFQLAQIRPIGHADIASDKDNNSQGYLMLGFLAFIYILTILSFWFWGGTLLPESGSEHGSQIDNLMLVTMILIFVVGIITQALLHYFAFIYRGSKMKRATFYADNDKLEFIWTIIPVVTLAGLIIYGLFTWTDIMNVDRDDDPLIVELYAKQFSWHARYGGNDNTLGDANVRLIEGINQLGVDPADPNGQDDKVTSEIHLPVGRKVLFKIRSQDVLHSAYMPHFRAQMNCVPGMITQFALTPTVTTEEMRQTDHIINKVKNINEIREKRSKELVAIGDEPLEPYEFDYLLLCNKICGVSHYNMQMKIIVESEDDYKSWLAEQPTLAEQLNK
ncbi:cytochrome c oxidase subunit II [Aequorivita sp. H23M31]|uniref:Cytochrome c oxidase subunit 2 n=1 Tax=Aequorivita ciconiae TaxID=2494375 RepID=A0A410G400_9FLAO|nr:cytochrome c oxidase subunit II [Aequorivita sp. H23M31]QAA81983.1 cytochrome c oxidase subunit II [Aequorivita sp. H23M31]